MFGIIYIADENHQDYWPHKHYDLTNLSWAWVIGGSNDKDESWKIDVDLTRRYNRSKRTISSWNLKYITNQVLYRRGDKTYDISDTYKQNTN